MTICPQFVFQISVTIRIMKKIVLIVVVILATTFTINAQEQEGKKESKVINLTYKECQKRIWDFEKSPNSFVYKGTQPAIINFYADDWCGPCRRASPIMEKIAKEYDGKLLVYKINVDQEKQLEKQLASIFKVVDFFPPSVLFIPIEGQPLILLRALTTTEAEYRKIVEEQLIK